MSSYKNCIAFDIEKFYGKWKYFYWYISILILVGIVSYVPMYYNKFPRTSAMRKTMVPSSFGQSIIMKYFNIDLQVSLLILFAVFFTIIIILYINTVKAGDFPGLERNFLVAHFYFNDDYIEVKKNDFSESVNIDYKNIISYSIVFYKELGHFYYLELKDEVFYLSFYNHNFALEIEEKMQNNHHINHSSDQ